MLQWTAKTLGTAVVTTLQDVLVHQRARWASLLAHQRQYEGWWKAEFALALESWTWVVAPDRPEDYWVRGEQKPRHHGIEHAQGRSEERRVGKERRSRW